MAVAIAVTAIVVASAGTMAPVALAVLAGAAGGAAGGLVGGVLGTALNGGNLGQCLAAGGIGLLTGAASGALGGLASAGATGAIMGALRGAATGGLVGGIGSELSGGSFWDGATMGAVFGGIGGAIGGYMSAKAQGLNPLTGRPIQTSKGVLTENGIYGTQEGTNPDIVNKYYEKMMDGKFDLNQKIGGFKSEGNYFIGEGHHRITAALKYYQSTGKSFYIDHLINTGRWTLNHPTNYGLKIFKLDK